MIFRAFDEFCCAFPAVFWSRLSPADSAKRLAEDTTPGAPSEQHVDAEIDGTYVVLRSRPFMLNPFAPIFAGNLRPAESGSQLVGEFRRRKIMLLLCGVSYLVLLPGIPFALAAAPVMSALLGASVLWGVAAGALFALALATALFAVAAAIRMGMYAARGDASRIASHIEHAFHRSSET